MHVNAQYRSDDLCSLRVAATAKQRMAKLRRSLDGSYPSSRIFNGETLARRLVNLAIDCDKGPVPEYSRYRPKATEILQQAKNWTLLNLENEMTAAIQTSTPRSGLFGNDPNPVTLKQKRGGLWHITGGCDERLSYMVGRARTSVRSATAHLGDI